MVGEKSTPFCLFKRARSGSPLVCEPNCLVPSLYATLEEYARALGTQYDQGLAEGHARKRCLRLDGNHDDVS